MNTLYGGDFKLLTRRAINLYKAKELQYSHRSNEKYVVTLPNGEQIHLVILNMIHKDKDRRLRYRKRASEIRDKYGLLTYKDRYSPNYWSYHLLW